MFHFQSSRDILREPVVKKETLGGFAMAMSTLIALLQDAPAADTSGTSNTIRIGAGVLALILVVIIILRRRSGGKKKDEEEEF